MRLKELVMITTFVPWLAACFATAQDCGKAIELYNRATRAASSTDSDLEHKKVLYEKALGLSCKDPGILAKIHNNLADTYEKQHRVEDAIQEYKKAIEIDARLASPYLSLGDIYQAQGLLEYAIEYYEEGRAVQGGKAKEEPNLLMAKKTVPLYRSKKDLVSALDLGSAERSIRPVPSANLYFGFDNAKIGGQGVRQLEALLRALREGDLADYRFRLTGHTCDIGAEAYNQELSERRAETVADWLVANGIARKRLETIGCGENDPLDWRTTDEARGLNRRVEIRTVGLSADIGLMTEKTPVPKRAFDLYEEGERLLTEADFLAAAQRFESARRMFEQYGCKDAVMAAWANLALVHLGLNNYEKAKTYFERYRAAGDQASGAQGQ
ncbi:MAG: OmpA family protein [Thermodesulfobacteriota bacterium]|nr:OmpA family protein [Thermodesulfobacteriota bacterium]